MNEEENKSINNLFHLQHINTYLDLHKKESFKIKNKTIIKWSQSVEILLNLITKLQKEVEHQKEKRENQKTELAILNEKQKEMNKLKNTVSSYCGMFRKQEREIRKLQKENKEKDNQIDLMAEYWFFKEGKDLQLYIGGEGKMMGYLEKKEKVIEIYKQRFEKLVKEKGE